MTIFGQFRLIPFSHFILSFLLPFSSYKNRKWIPEYSGKHIVNGDFFILSSNKSFLFRNKIIEVSVNHLLLQIESNNFNDSCIRFCKLNFYKLLKWFQIISMRNFQLKKNKNARNLGKKMKKILQFKIWNI